MTSGQVLRPEVEPAEPFVRTPRRRLAPLIAVGLVVLVCDLVLILGDGILTKLLGIIIALLVLTGLATVGVMLEWPRRGRLTVAQQDGLLVVPPVRALSALARAAALLAVLFGVPSAISLATGAELATLFRVTALVVAAAAIVPFVRIWSGRQAYQPLRLGADGLRRGHETVRWDDVTRVELREQPAVVVRLVTRDDAVDIATSLFACDPALLRRLLAHLAADRGARAELGSTAMIVRLQRGDF